MFKSSTNRAQKALCAASKRLIACLVAVLVAAFFVRVQASAQSSRSTRIFFPFNDSVVSENYLENLANFAKIDYIAALAGNAGEFKVNVTSFSSPEGSFAYNKALSARRAAALKAFIEERHPELKGHITVNAEGEAWEALRAAVEKNLSISASARSKMLGIIDSDANPDVKEARLKAVEGYREIYRSCFRRLRYAELTLEIAGEARHNTEADVLYFPLGSTSIDTGYADNKYMLANTGKLLESLKAADADSLVVTSGSSIDGSVASNARASHERGESLRKWIEENYPQFAGKVVLNSRGEDWDTLREAVESDDKLSGDEKSAALAIIGSSDSAELKEAKFRKLDSWNYIREEIFPQTRYAYVRVHLVSDLKPQEDTISKVVVPELPIEEIADSTGTIEVPADTLAISDTTFAVDTLAEVFTRKRVPVAAIATNLLYESATVFTGFHSTPLNVGLEVPVGKHWSVHADYLATAPWRAWNNNAACAELIHFDLGARWYPGGSFNRPFAADANRQVLEGWYAYASAGAGYYDFEQNGKGYQGEEIVGTIGLGYGLDLGHNWSLDFAIGAGPMYTQYRYYEARNNNQHLMYQYSGTMQYFGVTDAKISLRYLFHWNKKVKTNNGENK